MQKRRASRLEADSPFSLNGRLIYPQNGSAGVAHLLRLRTVSRMRTFIWSLDVEEFTSLILLCLHRFKRDSACALFRACAVSFQLWEPKRTHRSGLLREPITVPYFADIIIAWIYLTLLLYKR